MGENKLKIMRNNNILNKIEKDFNETWKIRDIVLKEINMSYIDYLKSEHWKKLKLKTLRRKRYKNCSKCNSTENINLHHKHYRFLMHIHELHSIVPLCNSCHNKIHILAKENNNSVRQETINFLKNS